MSAAGTGDRTLSEHVLREHQARMRSVKAEVERASAEADQYAARAKVAADNARRVEQQLVQLLQDHGYTVK